MNNRKDTTQDEAAMQAVINAVQGYERRQRVSIVTVYSFLLPIIAGFGVLVFGVTWGINFWNAPISLQKTQGYKERFKVPELTNEDARKS